jgi:hypothetical protein
MKLRERAKPSSSVITREVLDEIQTDIEKVITPSWFTKLQPNFGHPSNGKLKAAEWLSLFTVYLPITLIRLWAESKKNLLDLKGLLLLSIIVNISCSSTISEPLIDCYDKAIRLYLQFIIALNVDKLVINHHLSLHLSHYMRIFGPGSSFWAFPFERLIGKVQQTLYNPSIGKR